MSRSRLYWAARGVGVGDPNFWVSVFEKANHTMHILVFEPIASGHHMALYLRLFVRAIKSRGWSLTLLTTETALADPAFDLVRSEGANLDYATVADIGRTGGSGSVELFWKQYLWFRAVRAAMPEIMARRKPDVAYVMDLTHFEKAVAVFGSPFGHIPWAGILISAKFHRYRLGVGPRSRNDVLYKWLFWRMLALPTFRAVAVIDELFFSYVAENGLDKYSKVMFIPDIGELRGEETKGQARQQLGVESDAFVILVYGSLSRRKGVEELLRALYEENMPPCVKLLLAGRQDRSVRARLKANTYHDLIKAGRVLVADDFHDEVMEYRAFISADAVWLGYVGGAYGSSGVLYQACSAGRPVIATKHGLIGWLTTKYNLGPVVDPADPAAVAKCIRELAIGPSVQRTYIENAHELAERHTAGTFMDAVVATIIRARDKGSNRADRGLDNLC